MARVRKEKRILFFVVEEVEMGAETPVIEWYRSCIHESQRRANTLSIEIELNAREKNDPGALAEAMGCLNSAIVILEQAKDGLVESPPREPLQLPHRREIPYRESAEPSNDLQSEMDDLAHLMTPLDVGAFRPRSRSSRSSEPRHRHRLDLRLVPAENSLSFFQ